MLLLLLLLLLPPAAMNNFIEIDVVNDGRVIEIDVANDGLDGAARFGLLLLLTVTTLRVFVLDTGGEALMVGVVPTKSP